MPFPNSSPRASSSSNTHLTAISNASASSTHLLQAAEPPRKRQRTLTIVAPRQSRDGGSVDDEGDDLPLLSRSCSHEVSSQCTCWKIAEVEHKDSQFYIPGGDCVIRVEKTLFRIHRFILARDNSAFQDMFSLPSGIGADASGEGYSDENPIILYGELAADFRTLLIILYALPAELQSFASPRNVPLLLSASSVLNKYHLNTTEMWAVQTLYDLFDSIAQLSATGPDTVIESAESMRYHIETCPVSLLKRILEAAAMCQHEMFTAWLVEKWVERIWHWVRDGSGVNCTVGKKIGAGAVVVLQAMQSADEFGLEKLRGVAYYAALIISGQKLEFNLDGLPSDEDGDETDFSSEAPSVLTSSQKIRLLSGHLSLTHRWDYLRTHAPKFDRPEGCTYHFHGCLSSWRSIWSESARSDSLDKLRTCDLIGRLKCMQEMLTTNGDLHCALTPGCRRRALVAVTKLVREVEEGLIGHFDSGFVVG